MTKLELVIQSLLRRGEICSDEAMAIFGACDMAGVTPTPAYFTERYGTKAVDGIKELWRDVDVETGRTIYR